MEWRRLMESRGIEVGSREKQFQGSVNLIRIRDLYSNSHDFQHIINIRDGF